MTQRRFTPPWTIDEHPDSFIVRDATGMALAHFYFREADRLILSDLLTKEEARELATNFAKLPDLLKRT